MADSSVFTKHLLEQQKAMFGQATLAGFTQERIRGATNLPTTSLSEWANGKAKLSLIALLRIAAIPDFPASLLSIMFNGTGRHIGDDKDLNGDLDVLGCETARFTAEYCEAKADGKITPAECARLRKRAKRIAFKALNAS